MQNFDTPTSPIFVDATGRRASFARRGTQVVAVLLVAYVLLFAAAVVHAPGATHVSLPGVGPLFPDVKPKVATPDVPSAHVVAVGASRTPTAAEAPPRPVAATQSDPVTTSASGTKQATAAAPSQQPRATSHNPSGNGKGNANDAAHRSTRGMNGGGNANGHNKKQ